MFPQKMFLSCPNGETLRETCFLNNVSSFAGVFKPPPSPLSLLLNTPSSLLNSPSLLYLPFKPKE